MVLSREDIYILLVLKFACLQYSFLPVRLHTVPVDIKAIFLDCYFTYYNIPMLFFFFFKQTAVLLAAAGLRNSP